MLSAVVVGAGFSGIAAGVTLRRAGITDFVILEKADRVGGTWRENTYPGAACDVPSHLYSFSFEPNPRWSRAFGAQPEILAYLEHCADKYGLRPHLKLQAVSEARWDRDRWIVTTGKGERFEARALLLGNGALHLPSLPDVRGLDRFEGTQFHSARWNHGYDLRDKRVAVIGTGASAIQFVPQIAPLVKDLHVFQRTAAWVVPKADREMSPREMWAFEHVPGAHWLRRTSQYWKMESSVIGFAYAPKVLALAEKLVVRHIGKQVRDPVLRKKLTPTYRLGCKRVLISNDWYPAMQRDNVELVTDGISEITPRGVRTVDGREREVDAIICGTGFKVSEYLSSIRILGTGGTDLNDVWRKGLRNFLGITVSGFPNLFLLMGPNTGLGHNSMIFMIEAQARYAAQAIAGMREHRVAAMDVRPEVESAFKDELARKMKNTVWMTGCQSWYQTPDGEVFLWPAATIDYWWKTRRVDFEQYALTREAIDVVARAA
ncbi:MAG: NAD(P)/FAD-dependent oxidoreductase [Deltaproteobacteria bacterium]|nr:NAD(P)/FAD-dependent oxidoreductase [Deltaproteobacteria bacterium]